MQCYVSVRKHLMAHDLTIIWIMTIGFGLAGLFGFVARKLGLPTILGYLSAGFLIGPYSPGFVADMQIAEQLAEIGVILMLFGVGLHFKLQDLIDVKRIAIPGAFFQTLSATVCTVLVLYAYGWTLTSGVIMGLAIGVASTVVLVRVLTDFHLLGTKEGHIAIGWLVVEDLLTVIVLILIPTFANFPDGQTTIVGLGGIFAFVLAKFVILALFMFTWGHKIVEYVLKNVARLRSQELFILAVIALMFAIAMGSAYVFGTSIALGAFIAGMVIGKTSVRHQAAANALPLKELFAVIFFLTVGMIFNPVAIAENFIIFAGITFIILIIKPLTAYMITHYMGYSSKVSLTVALSLAQIGEFSFILAEESLKYDLVPETGFDVLVACAIVSISINPLLFQFIDNMDKYVSKWSRAMPFVKMDADKPSLNKKIIIIGLGPIGRKVASIVEQHNYFPVIIESNIDTVAELEEDYEILFGDATESVILEEAGIKEAAYLIITIPDTENAVAIIDAARNINPKIQIITRVSYLSEIEEMRQIKVKYVCSEAESQKQFTQIVTALLEEA